MLMIFLTWLLLTSARTAAQLPVIESRSVARSQAAETAKLDAREEWYRIEFDGKAVGHESVSTTSMNSSIPEPPAKPGAEQLAKPSLAEPSAVLVRRVRETRLKLRRFGTDLSVSAHLETVEASDGTLHSWSLRRTGAAGSLLERTGIWNPEKSGFEVNEKVDGTVREEFLLASLQPRSPILPAWILQASQNSGRLWHCTVLFPETAAIVDIEIESFGKQTLRLSNNRTVAVTRFNFWPTNQPELKTSIYYDERNSVVRTEQPLVGQTLRLERTDTADALGTESLEALDLQFSSVLPLKRQVTNLDRLPTLKLRLSTGKSEQINLPNSDFQTVEQTSAGDLIVTLTRPELPKHVQDRPVASSQKNRVHADYTSASRWITSDADNVRRMGVMVAGGTSIPVEKCRRLTRHVWKQMRTSPFSTTLMPASSVAKTMQGDCTEHAVLLSALLRSQGIPSRVVVGFVYVPNPASYAPHMWTEVFLDGKWFPLDSTRGPDGVGLTHIKVSDSALSDEVGSGTVMFVPLLSFLGRAMVDVAPQ